MKVIPQCTAALAVLALAGALGAQLEVKPVTGPVQHFGLDWDTGTVYPISGPTADGEVVTHSNVTLSGQYGIPTPAQIYMDWQVKSGAQTGDITTFDFGYATTALDPAQGGPGARLRVVLFEGTLGNCAPTDPGVQKFARTFTGLPGSPDGIVAPAFLMTITPPNQINLADGPIGIAYGLGDGVTGPLLITVGADGTGNVDQLDIYINNFNNCANTTSFSTAGIASFYLEVREDDGLSAKATVRNGTGVNAAAFASVTLPFIGTSWDSTIVLPSAEYPASIVAIGGAVPPGFVPQPFPFGVGELLLDLTLGFPTLVVAGTTHSIPVPNNLAFLGVPLSTQGMRVRFIPNVIFAIEPLNAIDLGLGN